MVPCPEPGPEVGRQWKEHKINDLAPAVGSFMAEIKRYCKAVRDSLRYDAASRE